MIADYYDDTGQVLNILLDFFTYLTVVIKRV